jgi:mannose-1-phosphate guanylyltransferase
MQAVIIAGGKGTRLRPLTYGCPKPMLPLFNRPFLAWMIERCRQVGIVDILLNVHYQAHQVVDYFGDGTNFGVNIRYIEESTPLDTAGALKLAEPFFTGQPLLVFNADILTDLDLKALIDYHRSQKAQATITLTRVSDITPFGLVEIDRADRVLAFREKPNFEEAQIFLAKGINTINAGTYILQPDLFANYVSGEPLSFERQVFPYLLSQGQKVMGFVSDCYWLDVGTPQKYVQAHSDLLLEKLASNLSDFAHQREPGIWISPTATVSEKAKLNSPCFIGDRAEIGENAIIPSHTVINANSYIDGEISSGIYAPGTLIYK